MAATTLADLVAAVKATNAVIADPAATQKDLEAAAETEHQTVAAWLDAEHAAARTEAEAG